MKLILSLIASCIAANVVATTPICPPSLANSINISNGTNHYEGAILHYAVVPSSPSDANNGILCGRLEVLNNDGSWVGIGISRNYNMFGSEAIIGLPIDTLSDGITKQNTVMKYKLGGYTVGYEVGGWGVYYMAEEKQTLTNTSLVLEETENGDEIMIMTFTKLLIEEEEIPIKENGTNVFLFASGTSLELGPHADYGISFTRDFSEDEEVEEEDTTFPAEQQPAIFEPTCDCQPLGPPDAESFVVTRLWDISPSSGFNDQDVIDEFNKGFAPIVTALPGFQRYTASYTGNSSTVFFMNAFDTQELAHAAQEAAKDFVANGVLKNVITPNTFTEDEVIIGFGDECITESSKGHYLSTRVFEHEEGYVRPDNEIEIFTDIADIVSTVEGNIMYAVSTTSLGESPQTDFRWDIYETQEGSDKISSIMTPLSANGTFGDINALKKLVAVTEGEIAFDYLCASPANLPVAESGEDVSVNEKTPLPEEVTTSNVASSLNVHIIYSVLICITLVGGVYWR